MLSNVGVTWENTETISWGRADRSRHELSVSQRGHRADKRASFHGGSGQSGRAGVGEVNYTGNERKYGSAEARIIVVVLP